MITIYVWPDYSWEYAEDFDSIDMAWRGDDYMAIDIPDTVSEEDIDSMINSAKVQG